MSDERSAAGDSATAEVAARKALAAAPDSAESALRLARVIEPTSPAEALDLYRRAIAAKSRSAEPFIAVGHAQEAAGDNAGAEATYRDGLKVSPKSFELNEGLGRALLRQGKMEDALCSLGSAAKYGREAANVRDPVWFRGAPLYSGGGVSFIAPIYTKARVTSVCGYATPLAQECFYVSEFGCDRLTPPKEGDTQQPVYLGPVYDYVLGRAMLRCGLPEQALPILRDAATQLPECADAKVALAQAQAALGQREEAERLLREAQALAPDDEDIARQLQAVCKPE